MGFHSNSSKYNYSYQNCNIIFLDKERKKIYATTAFFLFSQALKIDRGKAGNWPVKGRGKRGGDKRKEEMEEKMGM